MSVIQSVLPILRWDMSRMRIAHSRDKVYKDECVYSFDSPYSDSGLYVNMITLNGVGQRFLIQDSKKTGCKVYLHQRWHQIPKPEQEAKQVEAPTKLAIGLEGGFGVDSDKYEVVKEHTLAVIQPDDVVVTVPFPSTELPEFITNVANAIIAHEGMKRNMQVTTWEADQEKIVSKYADGLPQLNPEGLRIPQDPKQWKDAASDATENLWLNLSTGYIGGGRRNWDGTGGSGSALQHYLDTGKRYPLVVKLGTITPHGADVWSYSPEEDCLVIDPNLAEHLSFWGINIMKLEKTDKTLGEMEVDLNVSYDWSRLMDGQDTLTAISAPGFLGLRNIGSSCYMNAAVQSLLSVPEVQERYCHTHTQIVDTLPPAVSPVSDITLQMSKVAEAMFSERYVPPAAMTTEDATMSTANDEQCGNNTQLLEKYVLAPRMFKQAVAKEHPEFSTGRQQDVSEYLSHLLEVLRREERTSLTRFGAARAEVPTSALFEFHVEQRLKHVHSAQVKLSTPGQATLQTMMSLPVPRDKAHARAASSALTCDEGVEAKRPRIDPTGAAAEAAEQVISLEDCLSAWQGNEVVNLTHPTLGTPQPFLKTTRFATFPRYLIVKLERYYLGDNWVQRKISAAVPMPMHWDLEPLRGSGVLPGEELLSDHSSASANATVPAAASAVAFEPDAALVMQLVSMGFSENGATRAAVATHNADVDTAMNWVLEHMGDDDFNDPPVLSQPQGGAASSLGGASSKPQMDAAALEMLQSMGFTAEQCTAALLATNNNAERAADWLFSHDADLDSAVQQVLNNDPDAPAATSASSAGTSGSLEGLAAERGRGEYSLLAVISHIGNNAEHGHYVCHVQRQGRWALFNDEKVGAVSRPPLEHGFIYIYRRDDGPGSFY